MLHNEFVGAFSSVLANGADALVSRIKNFAYVAYSAN